MGPWVLGFLMGAVALCHPLKNSGDSGIFGPKYSALVSYFESVEEKYQNYVRLINYGFSVQGKPLKLLFMGKSHSGATKNRPALYFSGATHGNEYLNIADRLPELLLESSRKLGPIHNFIESGGVIIAVPILNPDGYEVRTRGNANGIDLNRDWDVFPAGYEGFQQLETKNLKSILEQLRDAENLKFEIMVDYHCCAGALLHPWSYSPRDLPPADLLAHQAIGALAKQFFSLTVGATGQVLGYRPLGTTKDYFYSHFGAKSFTYEGRYRIERDALERHFKWWETLVQFTKAGQKSA